MSRSQKPSRREASAPLLEPLHSPGSPEQQRPCSMAVPRPWLPPRSPRPPGTRPATTTRPPRVINYGPCKPSRRPGGGRGGHKHRHRGPKPTAPSGGGRRTHHDARHNFAIAKHLPKVISYDRPTNGSRAGHGIWRVTSSPTTGAPGKHAARMQPVAYLRSLFLVCCLPVRLPVCHRLFSSNFPCRDAVVVCGHVRRKSIVAAASNSTVHFL